MQEDAFIARYQSLNEAQRQAVDAIYGPVMVIAGPGTGKTEVLSMRIANLLRSDAQVQAREILCLTYTDEATNAMRRRLLQIIGQAAHHIQICTFHAFCNTIIQNHPEYFSQRSLQPATDLERTELLYELLEELPANHPLHRSGGNIYYDAGRIGRLFELMKREHLQPQHISEAVEAYLASLPLRPEYIYQKSGKGYQKGGLKTALIAEEQRRMEQTRAAALLFEAWEQKMRQHGRYDFNDMILWVLDALRSREALRQTYQERFQYILVDEFQDTNGAQNELLRILTEDVEQANIFVVGDDDQSIFEFQGARIRNILDFYEQYQPRIIVLPHNYRSSQPILDRAAATIGFNQQRLINQLQQLDKDIRAAHPRFLDGAETPAPEVRFYPNTLQEEVDVVQRIEALLATGVQPSDIAVLYAQHRQAHNILALMERRGIPYVVRRNVNVLELPLITQILNLLRYLDEERRQPFSAEGLLFELLHTPCFGIAPNDLALLALYMQANRKDPHTSRWRLLLQNGMLLQSLELQRPDALLRMGQCVERWLGTQQSLPLPLLVEMLIYESGLMRWLMQQPDYTRQLQALQTFFDFVQEAFARDQGIRPAGLLRMTARMQEEHIALPLQQVLQQEQAVYCATAHGSKGNEFEHVFLIGCTKNFWEARQGNTQDYKLPDTLTRTTEDASQTYKTEVARRLFYVALTRAKKHLHISYALHNAAGRELEASQFVDEISSPEERLRAGVADEALLGQMQLLLQPVPEVRIALANRQYIARRLQQLTMSYTNLTRFLKCPLTFYYECILQVPAGRNDALGFGIAVHNALERFFRQMKQDGGSFPSREKLLQLFEAALRQESGYMTPLQAQRRRDQGLSVLAQYYDHYINQFATAVEVEYYVPKMMLDGVPVTGKIDKIELDADGSVTVVDYKTGDPDRSSAPMTARPSEQAPLGGDYWRQMVFYKMLLEQHTAGRWQVRMGVFDFVEPGRRSGEYKRVYVPVYPADEAIVRAQLREAWSRILNQEFDRGCGRADCPWCNFARRYALLRPAPDPEGLQPDFSEARLK